jgi:hypothetical protein
VQLNYYGVVFTKWMILRNSKISLTADPKEILEHQQWPVFEGVLLAVIGGRLKKIKAVVWATNGVNF